ncbi:TatD DNase family protein [Natronocella acetinitrilica]|uniref:TatD DNase family protein n=1 Tax=Natronocella acetinitrilica TaxID=414046 RepID=A0AAE3G9K0_9GAMM|nr:TatD family hydrolase [Natronocella acetinitrilica]MCP1676302.1 TatD DNase family protein [Natronocella acetinitrilica]
MQPSLVDSHCHLHMLKGGSELSGDYLSAALEQGVGHFLTVCVDVADVPELLALAESSDRITTSVGVHPCGESLALPTIEEFVALADHPKVIAIGETGLDYLCTDGPKEWQHERFRHQIQAARLIGKPLIIHSRGAPRDTARILREEGADSVGGIIHCFTEDQVAAKQFLDLDFHISLSGILTFRNADELRQVARYLPNDRLLVETDCPYLAPVPHRGKQNEPAFVRRVAECLAEVRREPFEETAEYTTENFYRLFPSAPRPIQPM